MPATLRVRMARKLAVLVHAPVSPWVMLSRPWVSERKASERSLAQLDGAAELAGGVADEGVLGVEEELHAEAAADVRRDDAELDSAGTLKTAVPSQHTLDAPAALGVGGEGPLGGIGVVAGRCAARASIAVDDDAVVDDGESW